MANLHIKGKSMNSPEFMIKVGNVMSKAGGGTAVTSGGIGMTKWLEINHAWLSSLGVIVGITVGIVGLAVNVYFQYKRDKRERTRNERH